MTSCQWSISILSANWSTCAELKEKIFLLSDDDLLLQTDGSPSNKFSDRSRTKGKTLSTFRGWSLAATGAESLKEIDGQVKNRKRKLFLLCDDDLLPLMDLRPSRTSRDRSRTGGEIVSTLRWWSVAADGSPSFKDISGQVENRRRKSFYFAMMNCFCWWISVLQGH